MSNKEIAEKFVSSVSFDGVLDGAVNSKEAQALLEKMLDRPIGERLSELKKESTLKRLPFFGMVTDEDEVYVAVEGGHGAIANMFATLFTQSPEIISPVMKALDYCAGLNFDEEE